jgi:hypothetical protein
MADLVRLEPAVGDGLLHGDVVEGGAVAHEAALALVDQRVEVDRRRAMNLAAKAVLGIVRREAMMPERPSRSAAATSGALAPIEDTIPRPVTTTRRMAASPSFG